MSTQAQRDVAAAKKRRQRKDWAARDLADAVLAGTAEAPSMRARATARERDAAVIIKERILNALDDVEDAPGHWEGSEEDGDLVYYPPSSILDKALQPALSTALKAQAIQDKREQRKTQINFWLEVGAGLVGAPVAQLGDGTVVEGTFEEVLPTVSVTNVDR